MRARRHYEQLTLSVPCSDPCGRKRLCRTCATRAARPATALNKCSYGCSDRSGLQGAVWGTCKKVRHGGFRRFRNPQRQQAIASQLSASHSLLPPRHHPATTRASKSRKASLLRRSQLQPNCSLPAQPLLSTRSTTLFLEMMLPSTSVAVLAFALLGAARLAAAGEFDGWSQGRATHVGVPAPVRWRRGDC